MTSLPPNADELVSAYVDGQAAPDEITLIESNDELMARVTEMRSLTAQLGSTPTPAVDQRELHISAALDAFDEMMGNAEAAPAPLAAVPTPPVEAEAPAPSPPPTSNVTSLDDARERRGSRRSIGLIAAAAVALVFVAIAAFGFGGSRDSADVAGAAADAVEASSDSAADVDTTAAEAMDEEDAMDDAAGDTGGISEAPSAAAPEDAMDDAAGDEPDASFQASADADEAMEDDEAMDDEEAMEEAEVAASEEARSDSAALEDRLDGDGAEADATAEPEPAATAVAETALFNFGIYTSEETLGADLGELPEADLRERALALNLEQGLFPLCQSEVPELAAVDTPTLVGEATVAREPVEVHLLPSEAGGPVLYVVRPSTCEVITTVTP